jgi:hypothetical protein
VYVSGCLALLRLFETRLLKKGRGGWLRCLARLEGELP